MTLTAINSLHDPRVANILDQLHEAAKGDRWRMPLKIPRLAFAMLRGKKMWDAITPEMMADVFIPVSRDQGVMLNLLAKLINAQRIVEFGTSFGISTIYLAAAVRDNGGGTVIGTELEPTKHATASRNLDEAGLSDCVDIRLGDAMETLRDIDGPVDMVLLDGWKDLYIPVLELITPKLRPGAVVMADNIFTFKRSLRPYVDYVQNGKNQFESTTLELGEGLEFSIYRGGHQPDTTD